MATYPVEPPSRSLALPLASDLPSAAVPSRLVAGLLCLAFTLILFLLVKQATIDVATQEPDKITLWAAAIGLPSLLLLPAGMASLPRSAALCARLGAAFLIFYFATEPFAIPYAALPEGHPAIWYHEHGRMIGLLLSLLALWRPALLFTAAAHLWMMRELQPALTGFYFSTLDIRNIAEVLVLWGSGFAILGVARAVPSARRALALDEAGVEQASLLMIATGIGAHLANYFWSGMAKLALDGGPLSWVLGNRLYDGIPGALEKGTLPLAHWPWAVELLSGALQTFSIPVNVVSLSVQLAAIVAPWRRSWLISLTLVLDVFHLLVWAVLGLLFWKWIALNTIIVLTLRSLSDEQWTRALKVTCLVAMTAGAAVFHVATLAWYETPGFASPFFEAEMDDGERIRIPNAYFLSSSYQVSQGRLWYPGGREHFNPSIWGSVLHWKDAVAGRKCEIPSRAVDAKPEWGPPDALGRFVRAHHREMLGKLDSAGHYPYYAMIHHHMPSPGVPDPFLAKDKRRIVRYDYVLESVCLSLDHGKLKRRVMARTALPLYDVPHDRILP